MIDAEPSKGPDSRAEDSLFPKSAGERLRAAREAQGLSLADVAARTRVPTRHLEAIESGDYSSLPTPTYAIGFAKAYARAIGEDEASIARDVRTRTAATARERQEYQPYEIVDPARVPPRGLAVGAAVLAVVVLIGALIWFGSGWFTSSPQSAPADNQIAATGAIALPSPAAAPVPAINASGQVTLTALDRVWVRVQDATGKTLFEGTMNAGDHFDVPQAAVHPVASIGRPDKLQVSVNGATLAPLGSGARPMKDVPVDAGSLAARPAAAAGTAATATPSASPASAPQNQAAPAPAATSTPRHSPVPQPTHTSKAKKTPLKLDLKPAPAPLPAPTGIY